MHEEIHAREKSYKFNNVNEFFFFLDRKKIIAIFFYALLNLVLM